MNLGENLNRKRERKKEELKECDKIPKVLKFKELVDEILTSKEMQ